MQYCVQLPGRCDYPLFPLCGQFLLRGHFRVLPLDSVLRTFSLHQSEKWPQNGVSRMIDQWCFNTKNTTNYLFSNAEQKSD